MFKTFLVYFVPVLLLLVHKVRTDEIVYDVEKVPSHCMEAPPVRSNYTPTGTLWTLASRNLTIYETLNMDTNPGRILIDIHDIFGHTPNTKQVADLLAIKGGFRIVIPDYFRGTGFTPENFPPKDKSEISKFLQEKGSWENGVEEDTISVIEHFRNNENVTEFGIFGFCWGGKMAMKAASELSELKVAALVHPASVSTADANNVLVPMYVMPGSTDPDMLPFFKILQNKFGGNCGHKRFGLPHGFAGARGNFSDPENIKAVSDVIGTMSKFFNTNLI